MGPPLQRRETALEQPFERFSIARFRELEEFDRSLRVERRLGAGAA